MTRKLSKDYVPLVAGLAGGAASTVLLYPLDLVKVRLQVNETVKNGRRRTLFGTMRHVIKYEGIRGIYQGLSPALIGSAASWGGYFFIYEKMKKQMANRYRNKNHLSPDEKVVLSSTENFGAACLSGAVMVGCTNPLWLIKTRMQLQMKKAQREQASKLGKGKVKLPYKNLFDAVTTIVREEGFLALYKGAVPALMLVSHGGFQFVTYEFLKQHFGEYTKSTRKTGEKERVLERLEDSLGYLAMGATSKIIASTITYPIQVIKSRLQQRMDRTAEISASGEIEIVKREYKGVIDCVTKIWKREGYNGFFKGSIPNALRVAPSAAITFVVYESITDMY